MFKKMPTGRSGYVSKWKSQLGSTKNYGTTTLNVNQTGSDDSRWSTSLFGSRWSSFLSGYRWLSSWSGWGRRVACSRSRGPPSMTATAPTGAVSRMTRTEMTRMTEAWSRFCSRSLNSWTAASLKYLIIRKLVGFGRACAPVRCAHPSLWAH